MNFLQKNWIALVAVVLAIIAVVGLGIGGGTVAKKLGIQVQNDLWYFSGSPISIQATSEIYAQGALVEGGSTNLSVSSSTATTTVTLASLMNGTTIIISNASSTALNVAIPATSTLSVANSFLPNVGDAETDYIDAASTTAAGLTLTAGSGVTLKYATSTNGTIAAGSVISLTLFRDTINTLIGLVTVFK